MVRKNEDIILSDFLDALLDGNRTLCSNMMSEQLKNGTAEIDLYEGIMKPSLYKIGELWEYNKI